MNDIATSAFCESDRRNGVFINGNLILKISVKETLCNSNVALALVLLHSDMVMN